MKPITVSTVVERPRDEVYAFLDVLANHVAFNDHFMADAQLSGAPSGPGGRMRFRALTPGRSEWLDLETVEAQAPSLLVERTVGAGGKRRTRGTYRLEDGPRPGTTGVTFELVTEAAPAIEKPLAPFARRWMAKQLERSMARLAREAEARAAAAA